MYFYLMVFRRREFMRTCFVSTITAGFIVLILTVRAEAVCCPPDKMNP